MNSAPKPKPTIATRIFLFEAMPAFLSLDVPALFVGNCVQDSALPRGRQGAGDGLGSGGEPVLGGNDRGWHRLPCILATHAASVRKEIAPCGGGGQAI